MTNAPKINVISKVLIRFFDIVFSCSALLILSPIFLVVMVMLRFSGEGEVFYRQLRVGRGEKEFWLLKFATMLKNSPSIASGELTLPNDPRVLPVGRVLRKSKINELPQLWNVFVGDMSFIGPRPQTYRYYTRYLKSDREYIAQVKPGLSGMGSILFRDEECLIARVTNPVQFDEDVITPYKGQIERWFVCNQSLFLYFELMFVTAVVVILPNSKFYKSIFMRVPPPAELSKLIDY